MPKHGPIPVASSWRTPPSQPRATSHSRAASRSYSFCLYDQSVTGVTEYLAGIAVEAKPRIMERHGERIGVMPITPFLCDQEFDQETARTVGIALEMAQRLLTGTGAVTFTLATS